MFGGLIGTRGFSAFRFRSRAGLRNFHILTSAHVLRQVRPEDIWKTMIVAAPLKRVDGATCLTEGACRRREVSLSASGLQ
jgi:hypothetical protein